MQIISNLTYDSNNFMLQQVPFVPILPFASTLINIALVMKLDALTCISFGVWLSIGEKIFL